MEKNSLSVPAAIVIAGVIIAGAVYFTSRPAASPNTAQNLGEVPTDDVNISPVTSGDHILGNPSAKVLVVEYSDTECPFCKSFHSTMNRLVSAIGSDGKMAWVYRHFPLWKSENGIPALHSRAGKEAEALECAGKLGGNDKFWEYTNALYATTPANNGLDPLELPKLAVSAGLNEKAFNDCLNSGEMAAKVDEQYNDARGAGANGTPFSVLVVKGGFDPKKVNATIMELSLKYRSSPEYFVIGKNNQHIAVSGAQPYEIMKALIESLQ